jgi:hypothetical protein
MGKRHHGRPEGFSEEGVVARVWRLGRRQTTVWLSRPIGPARYRIGFGLLVGRADRLSGTWVPRASPLRSPSFPVVALALIRLGIGAARHSQMENRLAMTDQQPAFSSAGRTGQVESSRSPSTSSLNRVFRGPG